jgi:phenylpropionate dioxygenase-like ring-hydroxylating dioxygenase large terminal subunit
MGERMVIWRKNNGEAAVMSDQCPHRGAALSQGCVQGERIMCPFHGFEFDASGSCQYVPANGKSLPAPKALLVKTYPTREAFGFIWIWWGEARDTYPELNYFEDLSEGFTYSTDQATWPVHYTRAIENQLDVFHLAFVHATTIGRGQRTISDGPITRLEGNELDVWVRNRMDDGRPAIRAKELEIPDRPPSLRFRFPNLWMNRISDDMRIVVSFTPVDEEHMLFYLRYYQRMVRVAVLRELVNLTNKLFSRVVLNQDYRVVSRQRPIKAEFKMDEILIPQDLPIILYRRRREELIQAARRPQA